MSGSRRRAARTVDSLSRLFHGRSDCEAVVVDRYARRPSRQGEHVHARVGAAGQHSDPAANEGLGQSLGVIDDALGVVGEVRTAGLGQSDRFGRHNVAQGAAEDHWTAPSPRTRRIQNWTGPCRPEGRAETCGW